MMSPGRIGTLAEMSPSLIRSSSRTMNCCCLPFRVRIIRVLLPAAKSVIPPTRDHALHESHRARRRPARRHLGLLPAPAGPRRHRRRPPGLAGRRDQLRQRRADLRQPRRTLGQPGRAAEGAEVAGPGRRAAALPHPRRHAAMALGPAVPARMHAGTHAPQHRADRAAGHLQPRHAAAAAARHRHRLRPAHAGHPALLHEPAGVRRGRRPGRADARTRLRPARDLGRRSRGAGAGAAPHPPAAGRRHLHRRGRIGRRQQLCARTRCSTAGPTACSS